MSQQNSNLKCPFRATIMTRSFGCRHGCEVTRRDGPDIACNHEPDNALCQAFFDALKIRALDAMDYADDLTTLPASVLQKIQFGGLLGLQQSMGEVDKEAVDDIAQLMEGAIEKYTDMQNMPFDECLVAIKTYKMRKRRGR